MTLTRNQFLRTLGGLAAASLGLTAVACGSDDDGEDPPPTGNCTANGTTVTIDGNHGHTLVVTKEEVAAAAAKTYDITGSSGHAHSVTISAAQFATLASSGSLMVTSSSGGGHTHSVAVFCA